MLKSGSLMGGSGETAPPALSENNRQLFLQAMICLGGGQDSEAFILLSGLAEKGDHPTVLFNLALCHYRADNWVEAQKSLEKALSRLTAASPPPLPPSATYRALSAMEAGTRAYLGPMSLELAVRPDLAKVKMLRLLIDIFAASGQWAEVLKLAPALEAGQYTNVNAAVAKARQEQGTY